jgi:hypothetical protein
MALRLKIHMHKMWVTDVGFLVPVVWLGGRKNGRNEYEFLYSGKCIQKFPDWFDSEINNNNKNKHSLRSNTKDYGGKTHQTDSQNSDTTSTSARKLYHLQFLLPAASPETFGYTLIDHPWTCCAIFPEERSDAGSYLTVGNISGDPVFEN